jgi:hypothetical protein
MSPSPTALVGQRREVVGMAANSETASFGATREAKQIHQAARPVFLNRMRPWVARSDVSLWRRIRCGRGRHEVQGGERIRVGGDFLFLERRCRWCGGTDV